jgi:hypothetical protein
MRVSVLSFEFPSIAGKHRGVYEKENRGFININTTLQL